MRQEASRTFRTKKREYLKGKIIELETKIKGGNIRDLYRGINDFKKGYQAQTNFVKDGNGNSLANRIKILNRCKHLFNQLLNVHGTDDENTYS
jgi:hypothetical protein